MLPETIDWSWEGLAGMLGEQPDRDVLELFFAHPDTVRLVDVVARRACRRWAVDEARHFDDMRSECALVLHRMLVDPAAASAARRIRNGLATALAVKFPDRVKQIIESPEWTGSRGMSTRIRRRRALNRHAEQMARGGVVPTRAEVVASFNVEVAQRRSDAARQGMLACVADLEPVEPVELDPLLDRPVVFHDDDVPLLGVEARPVLEAVLVAAGARGGDLALVVEAWLGHFDAEPGWIATIAEIVDQTGFDAGYVRVLRTAGEQLARDVLAERFGVTADDWGPVTGPA